MRGRGPLGMPILGLYPGVGTGEAVLLSVAGLLTGAAPRGLLAWARPFRGRRLPPGPMSGALARRMPPRGISSVDKALP
ncbi:hypothetical protein [Myxococcus sp. RHSTA-1-4]|uniref:hypothetical protein n=1 Tax=Myxococcus sp. RHSTA-1-4 TaxID=2874601 RepID=UPI001CBBCCBB|nr:hypothetical protein [Myxococcus sp. RHSTA-1-4]MBZ4419669.1 hypothetical protein [Myxococcus sp. RHSTA-1-4]